MISRALFPLLAVTLLLGITSCHPAGADFQECLAAVAQASSARAAGFSDPERVTACMEARGWRAMRPHAEPGPSGWARTR